MKNHYLKCLLIFFILQVSFAHKVSSQCSFAGTDYTAPAWPTITPTCSQQSITGQGLGSERYYYVGTALAGSFVETYNQPQAGANACSQMSFWAGGNVGPYVNNNNTWAVAQAPAGADHIRVTSQISGGWNATSSILYYRYSVPGTPSFSSGPTTVCTGATGQVYSIAATAYTTSYSWTSATVSGTAAATITAGQGTTSATYSFSGSGTVNITITSSNNGKCTASATRTVTVDATSSYGTLSTTGPIVTCDAAGSITAATVTSPVGSVYWDWRRSDGSIGGSPWVNGNTSGACCFPVNPAIGGPGANAIRVNATNGVCPTVTSAWIEIQNRNSPVPSSLTSSTTGYCQTSVPGSITLTANFPSGGNVFTDVLSTFSTVQFYSGSCGGTFLGNGTVTGSPPNSATFTLTGGNIPTAPGTYNFYARSTSSCETSTCATVQIVVSASSNAGTYTYPTLYSCDGQTRNSSGTVVQNSVSGTTGTVQWQYYTAGSGWVNWCTGANACGTTCFPFNPTSGEASRMRVLVTNGTCATATGADVNIVPSSPSITSVTASANPICGQGTTTLTANGVSGLGTTTVTWWSGAIGTGVNLGTGTTKAVGASSGATYYARVTDVCGNVNNCGANGASPAATASITNINTETTAPSTTAPSISVYNSPNNSCAGALDYGSPTVTDACSGQSGTDFVIPSSGLVTWLRADAGITLDGNGGVGTWHDLSGGNNDIKQSNPVYRPTLVSNVINGKPVVRFNTSQWLISSLDVATPYTIITISKLNGATNSRLISNATAGYGNNWLLGYWGSYMNQMYAGGWVNQPATAANTAVHMYAATGNGSATSFYDYGSLIASNSGGVLKMGKLQLNGSNGESGAAAETSDGDVAEVIVYNRVLSTSEMQIVEGYLARKYNVTAPYSSLLAYQTQAVGATVTYQGADAAGNVSTTTNSPVAQYPGPTVTPSATTLCNPGSVTLTLSGMAPAGNKLTASSTSDWLCVGGATCGVPGTSNLAIGSTWTIEAWAKFPLPNTGGAGNWNTLVRGTSYHHIICNNDGTNKYLGTYVGGFQSSGFNVNQLSAGWHHITAIGSGGGTSFYVDGVYVGRSSSQPTDNIVAIGNYQGGGQQFGEVDEVRIWNVALAQNTINQWMTRGLTSSHTSWNSLVGYYKMDGNGSNSAAGTAACASCTGVLQGSATLTGTTAFYTYTPTNGIGGTIGAASTSETFSVTNATTTGTVTFVASANSCNSTGTSSGTITVNQPSVAPTGISVSNNPIFCGTGTVLTATGGTLGTGANYQWGTGSTPGTNPLVGQTNVNLSVTPSSTTSYWVRIENNSSPCSATTGGQVVTVVVNYNTVSTPALNPLCFPGTSSSYSLTLSSPTTNGLAVTLSGSGLTFSPNPVVFSPGTSSGTFTITASSGATPGPTNVTATLSGADAACYTITSPLSITLVKPSTSPTGISGTTTVCNGTGTVLTATGGTLGTGANYQWGTGSTPGTNPLVGQTNVNLSVTPSSSTTYWVRIENTNAPCSGTTGGATATVTVNTLSTAPTGISGTAIICNGGSTTLTLTGGSSGTGAVAEWFAGTCGSALIGTGPSITVSPTSNTTYYVRYNGTCNTTTCANSTITVDQVVSGLSITPSANPICSSVGTLTLSVTNYGGSTTYNWSPAVANPNFSSSGNTATQNSITEANGEGTYSVTVTNACTSPNVTASVNVNVHMPITLGTVNAAPQNLCEGTNVNLSAQVLVGSDITWSWASSPSGFSSTVANPTVSTAGLGGTPYANFIYEVTASNTCGSYGPEQTPQVSISKYYDADADIADAALSGLSPTEIEVCGGLSQTLSGGTSPSGGPAGVWTVLSTPMGGSVTSPAFPAGSASINTTVNVHGLYQYTYTVTNGACSDDDNVRVFYAPAINVTTEPAGCSFVAPVAKDLIKVTASGGWNPGALAPPPLTVTPQTGSDALLVDVSSGSNVIQVYTANLDGASHPYKISDGICEVTQNVTTRSGQPTDISTPTVPATPNTATCIDKNFNSWMTFLDNAGNAIAAINDNGNGLDLGEVTVKVWQEASEPLILQNPNSGNCVGYTNAAMKRHFQINSTNYPSGTPFGQSVSVKLFFTDQDLQDLITASTTGDDDPASESCSHNDDLNNISELYVTKYSGANEDGDYTNNNPAGIYKVYGNPTPYVTQPYGGLNELSNGFSTTYGAASGLHSVELNVEEFSEFWLHGSGSGTPLPVEMLYIEASAVDNSYIQVRWATALEIDNNGFQVERSTDGQNWSAIGWVDGHNNTTVQQNYSYDDKTVSAGIRYYYRLKQIDNDGDYEYTGIVSAVIANGITFSVKDFIPNPATNSTTLIITASNEQNIEVDIFNGIGQKVMSERHTLNKGANQLPFNITQLAAGSYTAVVSSNNEVYSKKLIVVK